MHQATMKNQYVKPKVADYGDLVEMTAASATRRSCPDALRAGTRRQPSTCPRSR